MYRPLDQEKIDSVGSEVHYLSYYAKMGPSRNVLLCSREYWL